MKNKILNICIVIVSVLLIILIGRDLYLRYFNKEEVKEVIKHEEVINEVTKEEVNYMEELTKIRESYNNNDIVGILKIENTSFDEIVMQSNNNDYYLEHTVYHESNWRGQTFLDYRVDINNSKKLIIYGHNSPNYILPFKVFENYYDESYYNEHKHLYLQTDKEIKIYEIFSVYVEVVDWSYYNKMTFTDNIEYYNHIKKLKDNSFYDTGIEIKETDEVLIIQTCSTHPNYSNYENKFLLIIGKLI